MTEAQDLIDWNLRRLESSNKLDQDEALKFLLQEWPNSRFAKGRLLEFCRREHEVNLAAEILCLEPTCPMAAEVYLECIGLEDPYHDRDHEILGASYDYLQTIWPAIKYHQQVDTALRSQLNLTVETLKPWITPDKHGQYHASTRQMIAASRILWNLRHDEKPLASALATMKSIATALGAVLLKDNLRNDNARFGEIASLELLAAMGPCGGAGLSALSRFASTDFCRFFPEYFFKTLISIGSRSKTSLSVILGALKLSPDNKTWGVEQANEVYAHAGRALVSLFGVDSKSSDLLNKALLAQMTRSQLVRLLKDCEVEAIAKQVELFLAKLRRY